MELLILAIKAFVVLHVALGLSAIVTWIERKGSALIQDRIGANRAGAYIEPEFLPARLLFKIPGVGFAIRCAGYLGLINTLVCDAVKALLKEDFIPEGTSNFMHCLGPFMAAFPVFLAFAVVPIAPNFYLGEYFITTQVATINAGVLFILAMGSVAVYGVAIAGWTGNNKYSLMGGLRAAAQMVSYELALGISLVTMVAIYGTLDLYEIVQKQEEYLWGVFLQPVAFVILFIVGMAETKRGPFDLPEAESELAAGYFTEYSGMKFLLFWMGEFAEIALFAILMTLMFFGGWHLPFVDLPEHHWFTALFGHIVFMGKVLFLCVLQIVIRWTLPRFRFDQLMSLGWKGLLPISLVSLMFTAGFITWTS